MYRNLLKEKIERRELALGIYFVSGSEMTLELIGLAGMDFVIIEMEHGTLGPLDQRALLPLVKIAQAHQMTPIVRLAAGNPIGVGKVLDAGVGGVYITHVLTKKDAEEAVSSARFAPQGTRGGGPLAASNNYVGDPGPYFANTNSQIIVGFLIEDEEAVENFEEISDVEGITFASPSKWDLALSMGYDSPGHPKVEAARQKVIGICKRKGIPMIDSAPTPAGGAAFAFDVEKMRALYKDGLRLITVSPEPHMLYAACKAKVDHAREFASKLDGKKSG